MLALSTSRRQTVTPVLSLSVSFIFSSEHLRLVQARLVVVRHRYHERAPGGCGEGTGLGEL